ncbi:hypothetical protein NHX12_028680 [Muraenolepis orangiensis]|uniref:Reverse transcriptase domain-containing protein n=1 Tax=Muraenolepis orangiensis TaxID=630683 RepID=A0A9Q0IMB7_9TELE|nr:hypothetical protein NHX12_028680 [Muraenolepis orangiensis]
MTMTEAGQRVQPNLSRFSVATIIRAFREHNRAASVNANLSGDFTPAELKDVMAKLKQGKAPGSDNIHPEFVTHQCEITSAWLCAFFSACLRRSKLPRTWRRAAVIALLKPNKPADDPKSYRPISLLCVPFKILERMIHSRIEPVVDSQLPKEQAGFRRGRSTVDQVTLLTQDLEDSFQAKAKAGVVLLDLTAAYDTVWHRGLHLKLLRTIPDRHMVNFIMEMLSNRSFILQTSDGQRSRLRRLRNGVPQGSVLSPMLFNIYIFDLPVTTSRRYGYADDLAIMLHQPTWKAVEEGLNQDMDVDQLIQGLQPSLVRKGRWSEDEDQVDQLIQGLQPSLVRKGRWSEDEDQALLQAVAHLGERDWCLIKLEVPGRTGPSCRARAASVNANLSGDFTPAELKDVMAKLKQGKAPGSDNIHPEFVTHQCEITSAWLCAFFSACLRRSKLPRTWRRAAVIALLKPNKPADDPKSYRPISLLCVPFKILERMIHSRIEPVVDSQLPKEQAGFRRGRSTVDQVTLLTQDLEDSFQAKAKAGVVLLDLTAAYDTVWHRGLHLKLLRTIPDRHMVNFIMEMLSNRSFILQTSDGQRSRLRRLRNGVPQGSVLSPMLFNIYIFDLPVTTSRRYGYADDLAIMLHQPTWKAVEEGLNQDMDVLAAYLRSWRLQLSTGKTVSAVFHLCNREARRELEISVENKPLEFQQAPKYLGVRLDRTLSYKQHLDEVRAKVTARVSLIRRLAGTTWGASAKVDQLIQGLQPSLVRKGRWSEDEDQVMRRVVGGVT